MAKKLKQTRKQMSPRTKNMLLNGFKSVISNQAAIDSAKETPWWIAVILALFAVILPLIPTYVTLNKAYGSSFLASATYGVDDGLAEATEKFYKDGYEFNLDKNMITYYKAPGVEFVDSDYVTSSEQDSQFSVINSVSNQYTFRFYITNLEGSALTKLVNSIDKINYETGTHNVYDPESDPEGTKTIYRPSFIVMSRKTLAVAVYKVNTTTRVATSLAGLNWTHTSKGNLFEKLLKGVDTSDLNVRKYTAQKAQVYKNWKNIFNQTYLDQKTKTTWNNVLIYLGVYAGLVVFLGLMVFILTRGKNNPFNYLNFWVCQKIAYWLAPTPAILALIVGFIFSGNIIGQMGFIMLLALRVMWASMRQLRPAM